MDCDQTFGAIWELTGDAGEHAAFQTSLLYTLPSGERRLRVATVQVPTTKRIADVFKHCDHRSILLLSMKLCRLRAAA